MGITATVRLNAGMLPAFRAGQRAGAQEVAQRVLLVADARVPLLTGRLEQSGHLTPDLARTAAVIVHFDAFYALRQHEDLVYHHRDGRQAKFLETALADVAPSGGKIVAEQIRAHLNA